MGVNLKAVAALLGAVLTLGWAAVAAAFTAPAFDGSPPSDVGDTLALAVVVIGVLVLAAVTAVGARAVWRGDSPKRLSTGALCTVVLAGWPAMTALTRGVDGIADPPGAAALGLTALGGVVLVVLHRSRDQVGSPSA